MATGLYVQDSIQSALNNFRTPSEIADSIASVDAISVVDVSRDAETPDGFLLRDGPDAVQALLDWDQQHAPTVDWLTRHGVVDVGASLWEITIETHRSSPIEIVDMKPVIEGGRCEPALVGTLISNPHATANGKIPMELAVDKPKPTFQRLNDGKIEPFFTGPNAQKITLERGKKEVIAIHVVVGHDVGEWSPRSLGAHCKWRIQVDYIASSEREQITIAAPGQRAFEITGEVEEYSQYPVVYISPLGCPADMPYKRVSGAELAYDLSQSSEPGCYH